MLAQQIGTTPIASTKRSLAATLKFIADTLNQQGTVSVAGHVHDEVTGEDWVVRQSGEASHVAIDPATCQMTYHWKTVSNGETTADADLSLLLAEVQRVEVIQIEQVWKRNDVRDGEPTRRYTAEPPVLILQVRRSARIDEFGFYDKAVASQVAQAVLHASKRCDRATP
jgi:hypothetical protein